MLNCDACQTLLADSLYDEVDAATAAQVEAHLAGCAECSAVRERLEEAHRALIGAGIDHGRFDDIPERAALTELWENLQPALDKIDAERYRALPRRRNGQLIMGALAIAASVVLTVVLTPLFSPSSTPVQPIEQQASIDELISPDLMDYLTRAEVMLLLVANAETNSVSAVPIRSEFARDMALEANLLNVSMSDSINSGQSRLLREIEFMLLQIANLDEANMAEGVALLQDFMEDNSVLFKIRLLEMRDQQALAFAEPQQEVNL